MKTTFKIIFAALTFLILACDNDSGEDIVIDDFYIKAKVNGQEVKVTYRAQALRQGTSGNYAFKLYAGNTLANIYPFFSCDLDNLSELSTGVYSQATHTMLFQYYNSNQKGYGDYDVNESNDFSLKITEIKDTYIKGTFQGTLWEETGLTETIAVTEGIFLLPRFYDEYGNTNPN